MGILIDDFATGRNVTALPPSVSSFTWDTKVQDLLPGDWLLDQEWATEKANIRDILGHLTGLTRCYLLPTTAVYKPQVVDTHIWQERSFIP